MARERILVVDTDLDHLSRMYLALLHKKYKTEACNQPEEIKDRLKRFKPSLLILSANTYDSIKESLKIPAIVFNDSSTTIKLNDGDSFFTKPVSLERLIKKIEEILF